MEAVDGELVAHRVVPLEVLVPHELMALGGRRRGIAHRGRVREDARARASSCVARHIQISTPLAFHG